MKKYVALDVGDVRIGVAISDIMATIASPLEVIDRKKTKALKRVLEILRENNTNYLVVGIPKSLNGEEGIQAGKVREFIEKIKKTVKTIEIFEVDERLSTVSADNILQDNGKKGALNKRKVVDKVAASVILQTYLNMKK